MEKTSIKIFLFILGLILISCNDQLILNNQMNTVIPIGMEIDSCSGFIEKNVEFHVEYNNYFITTSALYETTTEQVIVKEAGTTNSTYILDSIIYLAMDSLIYFQINTNEDSIRIESNFCKNENFQIPCVDDNFEAEYNIKIETEIYRTIQIQKLKNYKPGGDTIQTIYKSIPYRELARRPTIEKVNSYTKIIEKKFVLPNNLDFNEYLDSTITANVSLGCIQPNSYKILD